jgi:hypothetical protein
VPRALRHQVAPSFSRLHERHPQQGMGTHEVILGTPPLEMGEQVWELLRSGPGTACQRCHSMTDGQVHPFNKGSIQPSREA